MTSSISLVKCQPSDLEELAELARTTFYDTFAPFNKPENINQYVAKAFSQEAVRRELNEPGSAFYYLFDHEILVGYMKLNEAPSQTDLNDPSSLEIERIYVKAQYQNKGYGKVMMDKAIEMGEESKLKYIWLGVWDQNKGAIRFYERNGFIKFAEHPFQMGDEQQTDYLMKRYL